MIRSYRCHLRHHHRIRLWVCMTWNDGAYDAFSLNSRLHPYMHTCCLSSISPVVSLLASETLDDAEELVDVTDAWESRGEVLLLAGDARLGDVSDAGTPRPGVIVARLWTARRRSDRAPALPAGVCGVTQKEEELVTLPVCVWEYPSILQHKWSHHFSLRMIKMTHNAAITIIITIAIITTTVNTLSFASTSPLFCKHLATD